MTRSLVRAQRVVEARLRRLQQRLNEELGFHDQRLRFTKSAMRSGSITWMLRNDHAEATGIVSGGIAAPLASASNDESMLYFGYNEEWQPVRARDQIEFVSSNLRFIIAGVEDVPDLGFRLEWSGAKIDGGTVSYPGLGAAHPHWHYDVDAGWIGRESQAALDAIDIAVEVDLEPVVEEIDLSDEDGLDSALAPTRRVSPTLAGFHRLHLPARTMWHELICEMPNIATPQQHTPESEEQVDRWLISALRYLKSEFQTYL